MNNTRDRSFIGIFICSFFIRLFSKGSVKSIDWLGNIKSYRYNKQIWISVYFKRLRKNVRCRSISKNFSSISKEYFPFLLCNFSLRSLDD